MLCCIALHCIAWLGLAFSEPEPSFLAAAYMNTKIIYMYMCEGESGGKEETLVLFADGFREWELDQQ